MKINLLRLQELVSGILNSHCAGIELELLDRSITIHIFFQGLKHQQMIDLVEIQQANINLIELMVERMAKEIKQNLPAQ